MQDFLTTRTRLDLVYGHPLKSINFWFGLVSHSVRKEVKVYHGLKKVCHGVKKVYNGVEEVYHGVRKVYHGVRKVYHFVRMVYYSVKVIAWITGTGTSGDNIWGQVNKHTLTRTGLSAGPSENRKVV